MVNRHTPCQNKYSLSGTSGMVDFFNDIFEHEIIPFRVFFYNALRVI
jgi:hypothetical protein